MSEVSEIGQDIIIAQVIDLIEGGIERLAKQANVDKTRIALWISAIDDTCYPKIKALLDFKSYKEITFGDLASRFEKITYAALGFSIETDTPVWIQKFILKSNQDHNFKDPTMAKYLLTIINDDLHAFMYVNGKQIKEISLEYILTTK